ncbi:MAG: hypothetical protein ACRYGP_01200 [Janthinobacterium lividum]
MPNDRAARPAQQTASITIPDQLQQAKQAEAPRSGEARAVDQPGRNEPSAGVLHELRTERAHD